MLDVKSLTQVIRNIESLAKNKDKEGALSENISFCDAQLDKLFQQLADDLKK